jgi:hypothetical protein
MIRITKSLRERIRADADKQARSMENALRGKYGMSFTTSRDTQPVTDAVEEYVLDGNSGRSAASGDYDDPNEVETCDDAPVF